MKLRSIIIKSQLKPIRKKAMKEKEYKKEIIRLETVLLEKEKKIQDLQDEIHMLKLKNADSFSFLKVWKDCQKKSDTNTKKYSLINIQKQYCKNPNNKAIYDALITILKLYIYDPKYKEWKIKEKEMLENNKILTKNITQLENERDLNND